MEQGYKPVKQELGWADFPVRADRADRAIRRHWALVCCAFCFCWWADSHRVDGLAPAAPPGTTVPLPLAQEPEAGEKWGTGGALAARGNLVSRAHRLLQAAILAPRPPAGAALA